MVLNDTAILQSSSVGFDFSFSISTLQINFENYNLLVEKKDEQTISLHYILDLSACDLLNYSNALNKGFTKNSSSIFVFEIQNHPSTQFLFNRLNELLGNENKMQRIYCSDTQMLLYQIAQSKLKDEWLNLWLIGKAAELTACIHSCMSLERLEQESNNWLNTHDRNKILEARNILLSQLHQPVPIKTLARRVGINENYLKRGFKEIFNSTIYQYFQEERMKQAAAQLKNNSSTVKEVATNLGYTSVSHFSTAFKKSMGLLPCELIK